MKSCEQSKTELSEAKISEKYLEIAEKHRIKVTLFITGKTFEEETNDAKTLLGYKNLEIGGHTYSALRPRLIHSLYNRLGFSYYGPKYFQRRDIEKTVKIIREKIGRAVVSWRTHGYVSNNTTYSLLPRYRIKVISDEVKRSLLFPYRRKNLIFLPINVLPDHEHIFHGCRGHEEVARLYAIGWTDDFGPESYKVEQWLKIVTRQIKMIIEENGIATLLVHPLCMEVSDKMRSFRELCKFISNYETLFANEVVSFAEKTLIH